MGNGAQMKGQIAYLISFSINCARPVEPVINKGKEVELTAKNDREARREFKKWTENHRDGYVGRQFGRRPYLVKTCVLETSDDNPQPKERWTMFWNPNPVLILKVPAQYVGGYLLGGLLLGFFGTTLGLVSPFIEFGFFAWIVGTILLCMDKVWPVYFSAKTAIALMVGSAVTLTGGFYLANFLTVALHNYLIR